MLLLRALLFVVTGAAVGRAMHFRVAAFALGVEGVFRTGGRFEDTVALGALAGGNAHVMAGFAVVNDFLVHGVGERHGAHHRGRNLDHGGADGQGAQGRAGQESDGKQGDG
jgi:hypothetical protein